MWTAMLATVNHTDGTIARLWSVNHRRSTYEEGPLAEGLADLDLVA